MLKIALYALSLGGALGTPLEPDTKNLEWRVEPHLNWAAAETKAKQFAAKLNLTEKTRMLTGVIALGTAPCVGNIMPIERVGFKGICMQDGVSGVNLADLVSVFPSGIVAAASWDKELMYQRGKAMGKEFRAKGINVALGPAAGPLGRNPQGGRNWEGFSPDPYLSGLAMKQTIEAIQSENVQTCAKHIVGNEQETQRSYTINENGTRIEGISSNIDDRTLHELYMWPFADAIRAGTTSMMCSYNRLNHTYACENSPLLKDIVRDELGFKGYIMSDWFATHSGAKSINSGLDLNMPGSYDTSTIPTGESYWGANITTMIKDGSVKEERLDEMVRRIMTPYYFMAQDQSSYPTVDPSLPYTFAAWQSVLELLPSPPPSSRDVRKDHVKLIRKMGAEATVLLKNTNNILPLKGIRSIGVFGNDAADPSEGLIVNNQFEIGTLDIGSGAGSVRHTYVVSPLEAIRAHAKKIGARVQHLVHNKVTAAGNFASIYPIPEVCLIFLNSFAGETRDRQSLEADWNSTLVVNNVARMCPKTIVVTHSPGVSVMPWANNPNVTAILAAHYPGQETGAAIVDVLWGNVNPSGRLPYTTPKTAKDYGFPLTVLNDSEVTSPESWEVDFTEGLMIDYRHFDSQDIEPLYEFGFGLSYTEFELGKTLKTRKLAGNLSPKPDARKKVQPGGNPDLWVPVLRLETTVKNAGRVAGATVPQLYVSLPKESVPEGTPIQVLRGFEKVRLRPGESKKVTFELLRRDVSYWDVTQQTWIIPSGDISFKVGFSSRDTRAISKVSLL
ncbi:beta-glucosidase [Fusarium oxysporum f. sp. raphani 54005]|uniref:Beta-glucosidase cel3A n=2 Tax=Fusarium oxysporum f. sp. raphani TaxID=96318 RepID=X0CDA9_FUSOX|nr:beta-glucosidase [Fusarium oxysporum f. sp. raphani 54005]KAG7438432.1 putative beta-glucosidase G [Fusarium oxysporum f. sp. raphani]